MSEQHEDDCALLAAWGEGDQAAGGKLIDRHFASLYRFFSNKLGDAADDSVQQTLLACVSSRDRFRGDSSFRTYLFAIARHVLYAHLRELRRDAQIDFASQSFHSLGTSPTGALARAERDRRLQVALQQLPADLQIALELHYWEDMSGPEIAEVLEIPLDTAYSRLRRAKEKVREAMLGDASGRDIEASHDDAELQRLLCESFRRVGGLSQR